MASAFQAAGAVQLLVQCMLGGRRTRLLTQAAGALTDLVNASEQGSEAAAAAAAEAAEAGAVPRLFQLLTRSSTDELVGRRQQLLRLPMWRTT